MALAAFVMATGALVVAMMEGRVPVFEIVVSSTYLASHLLAAAEPSTRNPLRHL